MNMELHMFKPIVGCILFLYKLLDMEIDIIGSQDEVVNW